MCRSVGIWGVVVRNVGKLTRLSHAHTFSCRKHARAGVCTHTHTCGSVKRFEHTREVKQLQETEQLQSRIKVLEAEVAKRQLQETEQLQSRIKVLETELAKRQIEMSEIETLRLRAHKAEVGAVSVYLCVSMCPRMNACIRACMHAQKFSAPAHFEIHTDGLTSPCTTPA